MIEPNVDLLPLWATTAFGWGPLCHGFGGDFVPECLSPIFWPRPRTLDLTFLASSRFPSKLERLCIGMLRNSDLPDEKMKIQFTHFCDDRLPVRIRVPAVRSFRDLDKIVESHLNLDLLLKWDFEYKGNAGEVLDFICSTDGFKKSLLDQNFSDRNIRRSKLPISNRIALEDWNTISVTNFDDAKVFLKAFQVPKKDEYDRLVLDGTVLNKASVKSLNMGLSTIHFILERLLGFKFATTIDAKSYFYQFKVADGVSAYFSILFSQRRGRALCRSLNRMCMGWRHAPCIAQRSSRTILRVLHARLAAFGCDDFFADVWVDNFVFAANSISILELVVFNFHKIAEEVNLSLHPAMPLAKTVDLLGFSIDLESKLISHQQKWIDKLRFFVENRKEWSFRDCAVAIGNIIWGSYARRSPLAFVPNILSLARSIAKEGPSQWESSANHLMTPQLLNELATQLIQIETPFSFPVALPFDHCIFSDAATGEGLLPALWAVVEQSDGFVNLTKSSFFSTDDYTTSSSAGVFPFSAEHIFFMELRAALHALLSAAAVTPNQRVILGMDNTAALYAIRSGHSGNGIADDWIGDFYKLLPRNFQFNVLHIASELNYADKFTRGVVPDEFYDVQGKRAWACQRIPLNRNVLDNARFSPLISA